MLIFFAESGAIGKAGRVDIITKENNEYYCYKTNYTYGGVTELIENLSDIVREEHKLFDILPILKELNFNHSLIRESYQVNNEWYLLNLVYGNHLLIKNNNLKNKLIKKMSNCDIGNMYDLWDEFINKEL